jgi:hypothetical protein
MRVGDTTLLTARMFFMTSRPLCPTHLRMIVFMKPCNMAIILEEHVEIQIFPLTQSGLLVKLTGMPWVSLLLVGHVPAHPPLWPTPVPQLNLPSPTPIGMSLCGKKLTK